jgi:hypothetical protein
VKYKLSILIAALVVAAGSLAGAASASAGGVYVITPHWWGWCPSSGVHAVYYFNQTNGATGGDAGDDIVWVPVYLNQTNFLTVTVQCNAAWESSGTYTNIRPTRTGQAWYIGSGGGTWHN